MNKGHRIIFNKYIQAERTSVRITLDHPLFDKGTSGKVKDRIIFNFMYR